MSLPPFKRDQPVSLKQHFLTLSPVEETVLGVAPSSPEFLRLPPAGKLDPVFSLSRSTWNNLCLPCVANGFKPPIRSISVRRPGTRRGIRLIVADSARAYFQKLLAEQKGGSI